MLKTDAELLLKLLDKNAIEQVLVRYCDAADTADESLMRSVFHADGTDEHAGMFSGTINELAPKMAQMHKKFSFTQHLVSNIDIDVEANNARSRCKVTAHHRYEQEGKLYHLVAGGRYIDTFEKRDGVWRIAHRTTYMDWHLTQKVDENLPFPF